MSLFLTNSYIVAPQGSGLDALTFLTSIEVGSFGGFPGTVINYDAACSLDGVVRMLVRRAANGSTPGSLMISRNSGTTWSSVSLPATDPDIISATCSHDGQIMYAVAYLNVVDNFKSVDGGYTWTTFSGLGDEYLIRTNQNGSKAIVANFNSGNLYRTSDYGSTWSSIVFGAAGYIAMNSNGNTVIAGASTTYKSTNSGASFSALSVGGAPAIDGTGNIILIGPSSNYLKLSTNGGSTFSDITSLGSQTWARTAMSTDGNTMVARTTGGQKYVSYNSGSTWAAY